MKKINYKLQYYLLLFFANFILLFPEKVRFKFASKLADIGFLVIKKRRYITLLNLRKVYPEKSEQELIYIARSSYRNMAKGFLCTLWLKKYIDNPKNIKIIGEDIFEEACSQNRGVMVALIHMGNMEATLAVARGRDIVTVAKEQRNPYIDKFIDNSRKNDLHLDVIVKDKQTMRKLMKRMKEKKIYGLFTDHRDNGVKIDFFGKITKAPSGAVTLALKYDMPLILAYSYFNEDNSTTIVIEKVELVHNEDKTFKELVQINTQNLMHQIERVIRNHPTQWMWFHDRWKYSRENKGAVAN